MLIDNTKVVFLYVSFPVKRCLRYYGGTRIHQAHGRKLSCAPLPPKTLFPRKNFINWPRPRCLKATHWEEAKGPHPSHNEARFLRNFFQVLRRARRRLFLYDRFVPVLPGTVGASPRRASKSFSRWLAPVDSVSQRHSWLFKRKAASQTQKKSTAQVWESQPVHPQRDRYPDPEGRFWHGSGTRLGCVWVLIEGETKTTLNMCEAVP